MRAWGAELVVHGADFNEAADHATALAARDGLHRVPSFHADLVAGVASYALELLRAVPDLDVLYVPIGMGSGACACIAARDALGRRDVEIVGVTSTGARGFKLAFDAGVPTESPVTTRLADGMAVRAQAPEALAMIRAGLQRIVEVSDAEVAHAMRLIFSATHNVAEGAGAAAFAAALQDKAALKGKKVAAILCGGNVDSAVFARVLNEETM
jgi:threonine dehydratase